MEIDKLKSVYIPHLAGQFEQANPVLFTGAGFSLGVKNLPNNDFPTTDDICQGIWQISFPGSEYEQGSSLQDLFEDARIRHPKKLTEFLCQSLTVSQDTIPDYYPLIFSLPWSAMYTLNIDDLDIATARAFELPRKLNSVSATKPSRNSTGIPDGSLLSIHLNGTLSDLPDHVTFSRSQYAERLAQADPWYLKFNADLLSRPIVFVGTSLDEPPLWQHLELRKTKGSFGEKELRPRSYLVTPTLPRARQALIADFNAVWLPMTAEEFADQVVSELQPSAKIGLTRIPEISKSTKHSEDKIPLVSELATDPLKKTEYLTGQEPDWADIQSGRAITRDCDRELEEKINMHLTKKGPKGIIAVTGTAGSGKSTSLMRAVLRLEAEGRKTAWIDREIDVSPRSIIGHMKQDGSPPILALADADLYGKQITAIGREVSTLDSYPLVLMELRAGRIDAILSRTLLEEIPFSEQNMPHLTDGDIDALISVLDRENRLGVLKGRSRDQQREAFRREAGRQLLVAMYQATSGRKFSEKVAEELFELEGEAQLIYALVSVASSHKFSLTREEIVIAVGDRSNSTLNTLNRLIDRNLLVLSRGKQTIRARHRVVANFVLEALRGRGSLRDILSGLILLSATKVTPQMRRSARPFRILRTFINHDLLFNLLDAEQARNIYGSVERMLHWDYHYWLQRGSLEVEQGDLGLAENFLSQAKSLAPDDPYVENEWAYLLFKKAIQTPGSVESPQLVEEATTILTALIDGERIDNEYPYHVLGSQGLAWARRGIREEEQRAAYLRTLISVVSEGSKSLPYSRPLDQLEKDLREELLKIAIR